MVNVLRLSALLALPALADSPSAQPRTCYAAPCEWSAAEGKPVKGRVACLPGFVPEHVQLSTDTGSAILLCACCPVVEAPSSKESKK